MTEEEQAANTDDDTGISMASNVGQVIAHPVYGKLTRLAATPDQNVELYRDESRVLYLYYNNLLRFKINPQFWSEAELSVIKFNEIAMVLSAGQPVLSVPLRTDLVLQEDTFDTVLLDG